MRGLRGFARTLPWIACLAVCVAPACDGGDSAATAGSAPPPVEAGPPADPAPVLVEGPLTQPDSVPSPTPQRRPRGLWVLCEGSQRVLDDPTRIDALLSRAAALGVSDLFVQVYRGGRAWYDASLADAAPYRASLAASGRDALRELIVRGHASGVRIHAWVNVLSLSRNRDAPLLRDLGTGVVHVDRRGRSLLDYPELEIPEPDGAWYRMGTRGVYLDPAAPGVTERLVATFAELVERYPGLDGLHLDYIRHPLVLPLAPGSRFGVGLDFGYGADSRARFQQETGLTGPWAEVPPGVDGESAEQPGRNIVNASAWDAWRRDQVTELVRKIASRVDVVHPEPKLLISAAVIPYVDRAYLTMAQDWRRWLEDGLIDFAVPMVYTTDTRLFRYQVESFGSGAHASHLWAGHGTWLFGRRPGDALEQLAIAAGAGLAGDALFSYDAIADSPPLFAALAASAKAVPVVESVSDVSGGTPNE